MNFLEAVELLGPGSLEDLRRAAHALFAPEPERRAEFDALFDSHFLGRVIAAPAEGRDEEETEIREDRPGLEDLPPPEEPSEAGQEATRAERLAVRRFEALGESETLRRFARQAPARLPRRASRRFRAAKRGSALDLRRALRQAVRQDGEVLALPRRRRLARQRRILLLIDVSGSMKAESEGALRLAHTLVRTAERAEVFTLGTRLTRVTGALRLKNRERALERAGTLVADWDGGTRLGDALGAFLAVPRFAGLARGAWVVVLSDGLERGEPHALVAATERLARLAWRLDWLSPLASEPGFEPRTEALAAVLPHLDALAPGAGLQAVAAHLLSGGRAP